MGLEFLFVTQVCVGILMIIFLQKINKMQQQIDHITKEVQNYLAVISEEEAPKTVVKRNEEAQNRLIQAVLQEYFP